VSIWSRTVWCASPRGPGSCFGFITTSPPNGAHPFKLNRSGLDFGTASRDERGSWKIYRAICWRRFRFFAYGEKKALLADINTELINLYIGIKQDAEKVWKDFCEFPSTKRGYYRVRSYNTSDWDLPSKAARTLYLNRTCFKGMWRHNSQGQFNVGYGGQDRRWVTTRKDLIEAAAYYVVYA